MRRSQSGRLTIQARERLYDLPEALRQGLLSELDLPRVKRPDAADLEAGTNLGRELSLRPAQDDVDELLRRRHGWDIFERGPHRGGWFVAAGPTKD